VVSVVAPVLLLSTAVTADELGTAVVAVESVATAPRALSATTARDVAALSGFVAAADLLSTISQPERTAAPTRPAVTIWRVLMRALLLHHPGAQNARTHGRVGKEKASRALES
jgi:hypothetical protein